MKKTLVLLGAVALLAACDSGEKADEKTADDVTIANPAAVYCVEIKGGNLELRGSDTICVLPDGTEIEQWELYRADNSDAKPENTVDAGRDTSK